MSNVIIDFLLYVGKLLVLTLGVFCVCGFAVRFCSRAFASLWGGNSETVFDLTAVIGTPVHELGHALMCIPFAHRITDMKLLLPPSRRSRTLGYVEHSYNRKNPWAVFGDLFISFGPIFSGIGVMVLVLCLCFPAQWEAYLATSRTMIENGVTAQLITASALSLLTSLFEGLKGGDAVRCVIGLLIILSVSQHITLSLADLKGCFRALLMYTGIVAVFAGITMLLGVQNNILGGLMQINLPLLSLFCVSIAFSLVWVIIALLVYLLRWLKVLF